MNPETTPGGRALKFYSTIRIEVRPSEIKKKDGMATARVTKVKIVKNKVAPPFREDTIDIEFGEGISKAGEILDFGVDLGILQKNGNWFAYQGENMANGRENAKLFLKDNIDLMKELDNKIREYLNPPEEDEEYQEMPSEDKE